jgi:hypothetical protein
MVWDAATLDAKAELIERLGVERKTRNPRATVTRSPCGRDRVT